MQIFTDPISAGVVLVRPAIQSANFVHGLSGWRLGADGSGEFQNVVLPSSTKGATITFGPTAPSSPNVGDLWYNTSAGLAVSQCTSITPVTWQPYQVGNGALSAWSVAAAQAVASFHGLNMIPDAGFSSAAITAARLADPATSGTWTVTASGGTAEVTEGSPTHRLSLMPSNLPAMWLNPGEQYYLSVNVTTSASCQVGIEIETNVNSPATINATFAGTQTVSGVVTIPAGATSGYVRIFCFGSGSATATFSAPVCQPAQLSGDGWDINENGMFFYDGPGVLTSSVTLSGAGINGGTDPFGNAWLPGNVTYENTGPGAAMAAVQVAGTAINVYQATSPAGPWTVDTSFTFLVNSGTPGMVIGRSGSTVSFSAPVEMPVPVLEPGTNSTVEGWHPITLDSGWSTVAGYAAPQYRMTVDGNIQIAGLAQHSTAVTSTVSLNSGAPIPPKWTPNSQKLYREASTVGGRLAVQLLPSGVLQAIGASGGTSIYAELDGIVSSL